MNKNGRKALDMKNSLATKFSAGVFLTVMIYRIIHDAMDSCLNIRLISCDYSFHICSHFD